MMTNVLFLLLLKIVSTCVFLANTYQTDNR